MTLKLFIKLILFAIIHQCSCNWRPYKLPKDCIPEKYRYVPGETGVICRDCERHGRSEFDLQTLPNTITHLTVLNCPLYTLTPGQFVKFKGLTYLHLEEVNLTQIEVGAFDFIELIDTVHIVRNYISYLQEDVFRGLDNITTLDISENNIERIDVTLFKKMKNLKNLTIASNKLNLETFSKELVKGLNLTYIDISDNQFDQIPNKALGELVNLQILIFHEAKTVKYLQIGEEFLNLTQLDTFNVTEIGSDYNVSYYLPSDYFNNLRNCPVVHLDLTGSNIYNVENDTFQYLTNLRYLNMNLNSLGFDAIRNVFLGLRVRFLGAFSMTENFVEIAIKYPLFDGLRSKNIVLGDINAANAKIIHIEDNSFIGTKIVGYLRFQGNNIVKIGPKTFEGLDSLKGLILVSNQIKDINASFTPLKNMTYLDLSENLISNLSQNEWGIVHKVKTIWLAYNKIDTISRDSFIGLPNLQYLNLYSNKLGHIMDGSFTGLDMLEKLTLGHCGIGQILNNTFGRLPSLVYLSFEECYSKAYYIEHSALKELPSLQYLSFQDNRGLVIDKMIFQSLSNLHTLNLDNVIKMKIDVILNATSFEGTPIKNLFISGLNISHFPVSLYDKNLTRLDISRNNIHHFDYHVVKYLYRFHWLKLFLAGNNPYICTCRLSFFVHWLNVSIETCHKHFGAKDEYICIAPHTLKSDSIFELEKSKYMCFEQYPPFALYPYDFVSYSILYFTFITLFSLIFRYKIRKIIFVIKPIKNKSYENVIKPIKDKAYNYVIKPIKNKSYEYDAYISYSNADYLFIEKELSEELDSEVMDGKERFNLAIRDRDFRPGAIVDNIDECMRKSRKLVFILSDSFLQNKDPLEFCTLEMNIALQTVDDANFSRIIFIQKGPLTENLPPLVDAMVRQKVCLQWPEDTRKQKKFWKHLRRELRRPKTSKKVKIMP